MKKQLMIVGIIIILLVVGLSGCTSNPTDAESELSVEIDGQLTGLVNENSTFKAH